MPINRDEILLSEECRPGECNIIYKRHGIGNYILIFSIYLVVSWND